VLGRNESGEGHEGGSAGEAPKVADLGDDGHRGEGLEPTQASELGHGSGERLDLSGCHDLAGDDGELAPSDVERSEVVAVGGVGSGLVEALRARPEIELAAPTLVPAGIATPLTQEEGLHPVLGLSPVVLDVLAHTHEVADRLFARGRDADWGELTCAMQPSEVTGVDPVGLDPSTGAARDHGGSDHVAWNAERGEQAMGLVAGGPAS
jgi:hypothetical protein